MCKNISEERLLTTTTLNNIKAHNYTVADYKLCPKEADVVIKALDHYLRDMKFDEEVRVM